MPRPARRTRAVSSRTAAVASAVATAPELNKAAASANPISGESTPAGSSSVDGRRQTRRSDAASRTPSGSSDVYGVSDRELKRRASLRQSAAATSARLAGEKAAEAPANTSGLASARGQPRQLAATSRHTRGPDASGLDIMDDTFADIDTNFGDHDLGDLDDDLDAFDGLDSLGSSPTAVGAAASSANVTHATDTTSSSFNVGLFRRGRPRQSSIHSRDDAPIRPSSRGPATPSLSATFNLGTFKRRPREPSILGRRRDASRQTSRDRDETSGSEMDTAPYTSDAESSSMATRSRRSGRASRVSQVARAAQNAPDSSMSSTSNTTSMLLMARTRTRATTSKKRKSEEGQRDDELPKRHATEATSHPPRDTSVMQSVEMSSSPLLSTPPPPSLPMSDADRRRYTTPGGPNDEIMAPPLSSGSSSASSPMWPSLKTLTQGVRRGKPAAAPAAMPTIPLSRQTPDLVDDASDISSPPSLTHSPNYRLASSRAAASKAKGKSGRNAQQKEVAPLTTAALAALLPQRHRRGRGEQRDASGEEDGNDELERSAFLSEDDDELAHGPRRGLRRGRSAARAPVLAPKPSEAPSLVSNRQSATKSKSKKPARRTYGSRSFSDKENQDSVDADESTFTPLPDDAFEDETTKVVHTARSARFFGEELEKAAKKFKEVDKWTLEFESVSRSSSPIGAR